jgi:phospholipid-binding lipoprotein MlaA
MTFHLEAQFTEALLPMTRAGSLTFRAFPIPRAAVLFALFWLAACGPAAIPEGISDPYEAQNRAVHEENKALDRALVKPASGGYGALPKPLRQGIGHFADNVDTPRMAVNSILQGRVEDAVHSTLRFVVNTTVGIGGLFDPATAIGLESRDTDFGETLHVWGATEGDYVELPIIGTSTERDMAGMAVDRFLNPLSYILPKPQKYAPTLAGGLSRLGDRSTYGSTVDSVLYDSADSYAQSRSIYLQNRRYRLLRFQRGAITDDYLDPYATEPDYYDPYEDNQ